jgi:NhaP-type Na+/H+ or K+/H+ antiporter
MAATLWYLLVGVVLLLMALAASRLRHLPLSTALIYLLVGLAAGPLGLSLIALDIVEDAALLERLSEVAVIISLFTAGLKLRARFNDPVWYAPLRLALPGMLITVALITLVGSYGLGLSLGLAVLLGAILAPTDPVLAADVQVEDPSDRDRLRFGLTGEAGLNDGTAFPFVMLGLGLLGLHELGTFGWRWLAVDLLWATLGGLLSGWLLGLLIGRLVVYLRRTHRAAIGLDDFLALGLIALSYGVAHLLYAYGFLAVFAAGLALRQIELQADGDNPEHDLNTDAMPADAEALSTDEKLAPAHMAHRVLGFNEQLERIGEVAMVVLVGALLYPLLAELPPGAWWFVPLLLLIIRPIAVFLSLLGMPIFASQRWLTAWFGIRGIGSIYYLMYAFTHGLADPAARSVAALVFLTITVSIIVHGVSVTPLMQWYKRQDTPQASAAVEP